MSRPVSALLSTENLLHNLSIIKSKAPTAKVIAMVKANAYGHGLRSVAARVEPHVDLLGVASIDEALALRKSGIKLPILLMEGVFIKSELATAVEENFHVVIHNEKQLQWVISPKTSPTNTWLKVDTGMGRLGFEPEEIPEIYSMLLNSQNVAKPIRLISHFACADMPNHPLTDQQLQKFQQLTREIKTEYSLANSAAIFSMPSTYYDFIRPGIALYGASPIHGLTAKQLELKPVMTLQSQLIAVKKKRKGQSIGYGDGYPRDMRQGAPMLVNNVQCELIGRVAMDMIAVDLRPAGLVSVGDNVVLWGKNLPIENLLKYTDYGVYRILTSMQNRVKCIWE